MLFLGVAGSSAFNDQRDVRLEPGETTKVADYEVTYREPTAAILDDRVGHRRADHRSGPSSREEGRRARDDAPRAQLLPAADRRAGPVGRFFEGEATSEVDLRWGLEQDLWLAVQPDLRKLKGPIKARQRPAASRPAGEAIVAVASHYANDPPPAPFRAIVSPLVVWIWLGGGIVMPGALLALWPSPEARRRRVTSLYAARLGRELSRA